MALAAPARRRPRPVRRGPARRAPALARLRRGGHGPRVEARAAAVPDAFAVSLYGPDTAVPVRHRPAGWNRADAWDLEVPERSFVAPSASRIDREGRPAGPAAAGLAPRLLFRWKRDGRLSRDMTCCLCGRSVRGRRSKEPDITVAMFRAAKHDGGLVTVYEPNMARVDVDDPKGLEIALLLAAVVIRDLHLAPHPDPFNLAAGLPDRLPAHAGRHADAEEQRRIRTMLDDEDRQRRQREADVERETERLRREYGVPAPDKASAGPAPALPPRTGQDGLPARYGGR